MSTESALMECCQTREQTASTNLGREVASRLKALCASNVVTKSRRIADDSLTTSCVLVSSLQCQ